MIENEPSLLPVLEPLCYATGQILKPLQLFANDFLEIDVDSEMRAFIVEPATYRPKIDNEELKENVSVITYNEKEYVRDSRTPSWDAGRWLNRVPEKKQVSCGRWKIAGTDFSAIVMRHSWPYDKFVWKSNEAKLMFEFLLKRFFSQTKSAIIAARFKVDKQVPEMPSDYQEHPDLPLTNYQKVALMITLDKEAAALFMEQGTGKTPIVIARINLEGRRKREGQLLGCKADMYRALIICPQQVRRNWEAEFERFSVRPGKVTVLRGSAINRIHCLIDGVRKEADCEWSACIVSTDSVASTYEALRRIPWDLIVLDESHYIKQSGTLRFKAIKKFNGPNVRSRMILTGTPVANSVMDLWSQFEFLGEGLSGFLSFKNFRSFHGRFVEIGGSAVQKLIGVKGVPLIQERLSRIAFMIRKEEALDLPAKVYDIYEVAMSHLQAEWYRKMADELAIEIEENLADETKTMTVDHILTMLLRLAQITSGHVKWDVKFNDETEELEEGKVEQIPGENPKVKAVLDLIKDPEKDSNCKTIVWACFVEDIRVLSEALAKEGIKHVGYHGVVQEQYRVKGADIAEEVFNKDKNVKVLIANPASGGTGQNFLGYDVRNPDNYKTFCGHEIYVSCNWSAVQRSQSEDRAHRRGTRFPVRITDIVVPGTIDEDIRARVLQKKIMALQIQDVRNMLKRILGREVSVENGQ